ncbi:MAG: hypothetical protein JWM93_2674 [Frankiales bacterium]|nr:hypothetical protein [Frankiales bacterium]
MRKPTTLKRAIFDSGLTQKAIAAQIGLDEGHLSRIVNGLHATEDRKRAIAAALDRTVDELWPADEQAAA